MRFGKRLAALVGTVIGGSTLVAAAAFACTNLATLHLSSGGGAPGSIVAVTGSATEAAHGAGANPVVLHWNGVDGPVLATAEPDAAGEIHATFSVPEARPGTYVITATQQGARGTPARTAYEIPRPGAGPATATQSSAAGGSGETSSGVMAVTGGLGALGIGLFGAGVATFVRQVRRRPTASAVKVQR